MFKLFITCNMLVKHLHAVDASLTDLFSFALVYKVAVTLILYAELRKPYYNTISNENETEKMSKFSLLKLLFMEGADICRTYT